MSQRDCGKWYCQNAPGFGRWTEGKDVLLYPSSPVSSDDRNALDRERASVNQWFDEQRDEYGDAMWLAGPGHGNGAAQHYWVWDPDSRARYMEFRIFDPGTMDGTWGSLHRGRGWQLPLLAIFTDEPTASDLAPLKANGIPYVVWGDEEEEEPETEHPGEAVQPLLDAFDREYVAATTNTQRLGVIYEMLYRVLEAVL